MFFPYPCTSFLVVVFLTCFRASLPLQKQMKNVLANESFDARKFQSMVDHGLLSHVSHGKYVQSTRLINAPS